MKINGMEVKIFYERGPVQVLRGEKMSRRGGLVTVEGYTGKTVAVIWDGDRRHVGISQCAMGDPLDPPKQHNVVVIIDGKRANFTFATGTPRDEFSRPHGRMIAINRALFAKELSDSLLARPNDPGRVPGLLRSGHGTVYFTTSVDLIKSDQRVKGLDEELFRRVERKPSNEAVQNPT